MRRVDRAALALVLVIVLALAIRVWGLSYDLPYIYDPDEPINIITIQRIFQTGSLDPRRFDYPSLFFYINALAYVPYYLIGKAVGHFNAPTDILRPVSLIYGVTIAPVPSSVLLGRAVTVLFSVATIGLTYAISTRLTGKPFAGVLASLMLAVSPTSVDEARIITPDTFVTFFITAAFLAVVLVHQKGKTWHYMIAGLCIGLAASAKYNGALIGVSLLGAHFLRHRMKGLTEPRLYLALLLSGLAFVATTPFALLDSAKFLAAFRNDAAVYSTGHTGMEGNAAIFYLTYAWQTAGMIGVLAVIEMLRGLYLRRQETLLLSMFPIVYFVLICSLVVRNARTFLPLVPFICLLAASLLMYLLSQAGGLASKALRRYALVAIACLSAACIAWSASTTLSNTRRLLTPDSRATARTWISSSLPTHAKIAIESYSPFIDRKRFDVEGFVRIPDNPPNWYISNGFDYLVFSQGMYGRFYAEPDRYRDWIARYDGFFNRFPLIRLFDDGGYEVRVYQVR